ncbi:MAG TPA: endopeptidase La [Candidatus Fusicatenibacter intestinigallinarum]|uniref:Lon protease n=1 Tax=Candidatus Fusicatenibacter intestinigallinarum TaxID=2838598 RepID=A0A9D2SMZ8_9FIRM|nr:endopeptidase La [Candidatus Fusicatenibacter intestinigallinarum]
MSELIRILPAIALRGTTILPDMIVHFDVSRSRSVKAVEAAMLQEQKVFLVTQKDPDTEVPGLLDVYKIGTVATVKQVVKLPKGVVRILVEGEERAELLGFEPNDQWLEAEIEGFGHLEEKPLTENEEEAMIRNLRELFSAYCRSGQKISQELAIQIMENESLERLVDQIAINLPLDYEQRQKLLEAVALRERYDVLCTMLANEVEIMEIRIELQNKIKERIDKNQKEYILREQLRIIREELGDDNVQSEIEGYKKAAAALKASKEVKEKIQEEIRRFENVGNNPSEGAVIRGYIETLLGLPWDKTSRDNQNLTKAREILEADHYGLTKVKERILEYLAVRTLTKKGDSPILCLVGPPGTGKTSIARSVAKALGKKYVRISLGGVRDEAEIRGHRRTYVGAMPGRIVQSLHQAGVKNPLMLLDEIDKVSSDYKGDTASALLEVLDSEQNSKFADHYVEIPVDLSQVLFIATANDVQTIPRPLLDRMELIEITSYTENEKFHIGREHLIPKQMKNNGIGESQLTITDDALAEIISGYTKEAGVRSLERQIGRICRRTARRLLEEKEDHVEVTKENLEEFLDRRRFDYVMKNEEPEVGIVRGLAWTSVGGDTLQIEVNVMPGTGDFMLTGQLGDVMKESAQTGISYIRSVAGDYQIPEDFFKKHDIHIHIPEGAVPKDGPSAGITMATAMLSAIINVPVRADLAMTGEITLRGRVLPIGGLKEKLLAAKKAGITTVLVPEKNRPDVEEMDREIIDGLTICFVTCMKEVLDQALLTQTEDRR